MARFYKVLLSGAPQMLWRAKLGLLFTFLCLSCQEGWEAGDLWGQWRLRGSDTHYISFSGKVTQFRDVDKGTEKGMVFGQFEHVGDSLFIRCSSIKGLPSDTAVIEESFGMKPFTNIRLKIVNLDGDNLILTQGTQTWSFYRY